MPGVATAVLLASLWTRHFATRRRLKLQKFTALIAVAQIRAAVVFFLLFPAALLFLGTGAGIYLDGRLGTELPSSQEVAAICQQRGRELEKGDMTNEEKDTLLKDLLFQRTIDARMDDALREFAGSLFEAQLFFVFLMVAGSSFILVIVARIGTADQ